MRHALEFRDVSLNYGQVTAVDRLSLTVEPGEILCVLGPSGCGKTTALRLAAGLESPSSGEIRVADRIVARIRHVVPPEQRGVGLLFQDYALFPHLTVTKNILFGLNHLPRSEQQSRAALWLENIGLAHRGDAFPHMLSGGEQQRVALARAMAPGPAIMLLDEPFSNLDTDLRQRIRDQVRAALKRAGTAAMMVTHSREEALVMGDRIALMRDGSFVQVARPTDLYYRPVSPDAAAYFGEINCLDGVVRGGCVETPLGPIPVGKRSENDQVTVCVRAEALGVEAAANGNAEVVSVSRLGRTSRLVLRLTAPDRAAITLLADVQGMTVLQSGDKVCVFSDPSQALVF